MKISALLTVALAVTLLAQPSSGQSADDFPCGLADQCLPDMGPDAARLKVAWADPGISPRQRSRMRELITAYTVPGETNWKQIADEYFSWEAAGMQTVPFARAKAVSFNGPDYKAMRLVAEQNIRSKLIDPQSALFEWPKGFTQGEWKPFLAKRVTGYWTCGLINSRNRLGGYVGSTPFVVVIDGPVVKYSEIGKARPFDVISAQCQKAMSLLPPPQDEMLREAKPQAASVADEIEKLADLKSRGILTEGEFQARKARLLAAE